MLPFLYQVKRTSIDGVITILGWRDTLNPATPPTWWLGSPEFQFRPIFRNYSFGSHHDHQMELKNYVQVGVG